MPPMLELLPAVQTARVPLGTFLHIMNLSQNLREANFPGWQTHCRVAKNFTNDEPRQVTDPD